MVERYGQWNDRNRIEKENRQLRDRDSGMKQDRKENRRFRDRDSGIQQDRKGKYTVER